MGIALVRCLRAICALTHVIVTSLVKFASFSPNFRFEDQVRKRSQCFSCSFRWIWHDLGDPFLLMESHIPRMHCIELRATCSVSCMDTPTCQTLHVSCM